MKKILSVAAIAAIAISLAACSGGKHENKLLTAPVGSVIKVIKAGNQHAFEEVGMWNTMFKYEYFNCIYNPLNGLNKEKCPKWFEAMADKISQEKGFESVTAEDLNHLPVLQRLNKAGYHDRS